MKDVINYLDSHSCEVSGKLAQIVMVIEIITMLLRLCKRLL